MHKTSFSMLGLHAIIRAMLSDAGLIESIDLPSCAVRLSRLPAGPVLKRSTSFARHRMVFEARDMVG